MNLLRSSFLSLLVCAVLLIGFSSSAYAEEVTNLAIKGQLFHSTNGQEWLNTGWATNEDPRESHYTTTYYTQPLKLYFNIQSTDYSVIVPKNRDFTLEIPVIVFAMENLSTDKMHLPTKFSGEGFVLNAYDGTGGVYKINANIIGLCRNDGYITLKFECEAIDADILSFQIKSPEFVPSDYFKDLQFGSHTYSLCFHDEVMPVATVTTEEAGLIRKVIEAITELPDKIIEKLKDFILPDSDFLVAYKEDWDMLLGQHFGALYQSIDIFTDMVDSITSQGETQEAILIPATTINLVGTDFTFGGWEVPLIPDRFDFLVDLLKTLLSIVFTIGFIYMLKSKYYEVVAK